MKRKDEKNKTNCYIKESKEKIAQKFLPKLFIGYL